MGKSRRKVKTKEKKPKKPRNKNKGPLWIVEGDKVVRTRRHCPKCGPGVFMAEHYDRYHCGKCGYMILKGDRPTNLKRRPRKRKEQMVSRS